MFKNDEKILIHNIVPKFLKKFIGRSKRDFWKKCFDSINPEKSLGYASEDNYLESNNLSKQQIVLNSIKYVYNDLNSEDYKLLTDYFEQLIFLEKVKILTTNNLPIYKEIVDICSYIKQIHKLLKEHPLQSSEHKGTAYTYNQKKLIKTQINQLTERLNHPYFPILNPEEIEYTDYILKILKYSLDEKYKNLPEYFNYINISFGLDAEILNINQKEIGYIKSFLNFYNGIKTTKIELIQSVSIFINITLNTSKLEDKEKADAILNIIYMFFLAEINEYNKTNKKRTFTFNAKDIQKNTRIKTVYHDVPIYAYNYFKSNNFMEELLMTGASSIFGINNMFEPDKPSEDNISNFASLRSLAEFKKVSGFSKQELKLLDNYLSKNNNITL